MSTVCSDHVRQPCHRVGARISEFFQLAFAGKCLESGIVRPAAWVHAFRHPACGVEEPGEDSWGGGGVNQVDAWMNYTVYGLA
ncbi:hypothetical protein KSP40_PGU005858 [Platanthera guangdongensis]|uniref:Uncharacterized protein n=1 Tax=Platanthera guangdongensis TaxID=2320717 RepID=A0ABR2LT59_9ASPA